MAKRNSIPKRTILAWLACIVICVGHAQGADVDSAVEAELHHLSTKVPAFQVVTLPAARGEFVLKVDQSLTVEQLRGVELDDDPPLLGQPGKPYDQRMTDSYASGKAPYVARGIKPFRLHYFNCEFNYGGWHNFAMADYAAAHGFNIIYRRQPFFHRRGRLI